MLNCILLKGIGKMKSWFLFQLYKKRKIMQGRGKSGKQALNLTEEMVYEMNRSEDRLNIIIMSQ